MAIFIYIRFLLKYGTNLKVKILSLGINNNGNNIQYPYNQQKLTPQQQDNFGAISPETQAHLQKAGNTVNKATQNSLLGSFIQGLGIDLSNPKKAVISIIGAVTVIFGLSRGVNKLLKSDKLFNMGKVIDNFVQNNKIIKKISKGLSKHITTPIKDFFAKSGIKKTFSILKENMISPKSSFAKPFLKGPKGEALDTCTDTLKAFLAKGDAKVLQYKRLLFEPDGDEIKKAVSQITDPETIAKIEDTLSPKSIFNKFFKKRKPVDIQASIDKIIKKGNTQRLHELNEIINPKSPSEVLDAIKNTSDPQILEKLRSLTGKTDTQGIIDTVRDTIEHKNLRVMYEKLTGSSDGFQDFVKSIRELQVDDYLKYQHFEDFYSKVLQHYTKNGKLDVDALNRTFSELSQNPEFSAKISGWFGKSDMGLALKKYAILNGDSANTKLSQQIQSLLIRSSEGISNGVTSSSLMGLLMGLNIYNGVFNKTQEAPKGEKVATFTESAVDDIGNYMLLPSAASLLYGAATLKYLGSKPSQIVKYKESLKQLSQQAANGLSKADVKAQYKALKQGLNKGVKWYQKPIRKLANILAIGLEDNPVNGKFMKKVKGLGGGAMRFALLMCTIAPLLVKPVMKVCHKIFGKPTNTSYPDKADEIKRQQEEAMKQIQSMTPEEQYQALLQLSQLPEIANNPEQKAYIDQLLATYQTQISQQPQQPTIQQPQQPTIQQPLSQPTGSQPISSQPINSGGSQISSIDSERTYIPSDEPAPGLIRKDIPKI